jgi:3-oxo-5alpha-steroid 4-dehydrogenase
MDAVTIMRSITPPNAFVKGVLVNTDGKRYINEDAYLGHIGLATAAQKDYAVWLILDGNTFWEGARQLLPPKEMFSWWGFPAVLNLLFGGPKRASTLGALARKCRIDADQLEKTVALYNAGAALGTDAFGKKPKNMAVLESKSYYAINLSFRNKWSFSSGMPFGGLKVDEDSGAVITEQGDPIPGLFACGRSAVGMSTATTFSGLSIGDTIFSGRRAGRSAAAGQTPIVRRERGA